jgi:hypothetical protein
VCADEESLYKISRGQMTKMTSAGSYMKTVIRPTVNGRSPPIFPRRRRQIVRVNLATGKEIQSQFRQFPSFEPIAFVRSLNRVF